MATLLDRFNKTVIGSSTTFADFTDNISPSGDFTRITGLEVILRSWYKILITPIRTVDHDPEFGSDLYQYVFFPADDSTRQAIADEINFRLRYYDNRANILAVTVSYLSNRKGFVVNVVAEYEGNEGSINATIDEKAVEVGG